MNRDGVINLLDKALPQVLFTLEHIEEKEKPVRGLFIMGKKCVTCGEVKPIEDFVKDKSKEGGHRNRCKVCNNLRLKKTPVPLIPREGYKYCACCGKEKALSEYNIRFRWKKYMPFSYCKTCEHEKDNNRYEHTCSMCGKEYRSGKKDSKICNKCAYIGLAERGKKSLKILNANQNGKNNGMYGTHRFGKDNPNYKPDKTDIEREKGRVIRGYAHWRIEVYRRDNYACQCCGDAKGGNLNAHHLDGYSWCNERRADVSNGVTLCDSCHKDFHYLYGNFDNREDQFKLFEKNRELTKHA